MILAVCADDPDLCAQMIPCPVGSLQRTLSILLTTQQEKHHEFITSSPQPHHNLSTILNPKMAAIEQVSD